MSFGDWEDKYDSLKTGLDTLSADTQKIKQLVKIGDVLLLNIPEASIDYYLEAKKLAEELKDTTYITQCLLNICDHYIMMSDYSYALETAYEALALSKENKELLSLSHERIAEANSFLEEYEESLKHNKISLQLEIERKDTLRMANTLHLIGTYFLEVDEFDSALYYLYEANMLNTLIHGKPIAFDLSHIGHTYTYMGEFDSALHYHFKAYYYDSIDESNYDMAIDEYYIAFAYFRSKQYDKALNFVNRSISRSKQLGLYEVMVFNYDLTYKIFEQKSDYKKALEFAVLKNQYADTLRDKNKQSLAQSLEAKYRFEEQGKRLKIKEAENSLLEKQSKLLIILIIVSLLFLISTLIIILQINKRHRSVSELLKEVETANASKEKLISVISHDLRGSVGTLRNAIKYTLEDSIDLKSLRNMMSSFYPVVDSTYDLLENLLTWAQLNKEKLEPDFESINIYDICSKSIEQTNSIAINKQIKVINNIIGKIEIQADKNMLLIIFRNLISNAIKFSGPGSEISISCNMSGTYIELLFQDQGIGISSRVQKTIFSTPTDIHTKGTMGERGSGLGLSICKSFVDKHDGDIKVESTPGKGSTFRVILPLNQT